MSRPSWAAFFCGAIPKAWLGAQHRREVGELRVQRPARHTCPVAQATLQPPQWNGFVARSAQIASRQARPHSLPFGLGRRTPLPVAPPPVTRPAPVPRADTTFARFDRLSDTLSSAVRNYHDRAALFKRRQIDCAGLARGYAAIQNIWIDYNTERKVRIALFDPRRAARDQGLYASVDSVDGQFEQSHCQRP